jgi:hypothetical protein
MLIYITECDSYKCPSHKGGCYIKAVAPKGRWKGREGGGSEENNMTHRGGHRFRNTRVYPNQSDESDDTGDSDDFNDDEFLEGVFLKMFSKDVSQVLLFPKAVWETGLFNELIIQASCRALELAHSKDPADERTCLTTLCFAIWCHTQLVLVKRKIKKKILASDSSAEPWSDKRMRGNVRFLHMAKDAHHVVESILAAATSQFLTTATGTATMMYIRSRMKGEWDAFKEYLGEVKIRNANPDKDFKVRANDTISAFFLFIDCTGRSTCVGEIPDWEMPDMGRQLTNHAYHIMGQYFDEYGATSEEIQEKCEQALMLALHMPHVEPASLYTETGELMDTWDAMMAGESIIGPSDKLNLVKFRDVWESMVSYAYNVPS